MSLAASSDGRRACGWKCWCVICMAIFAGVGFVSYVLLHSPQSSETNAVAPGNHSNDTGHNQTHALWLMCSGSSCTSEIIKPWASSPKTLANQVGGLSNVPGIAQSAYSTVVQRWLQSPPSFRGSIVHLSDIALFVQQVLMSDPFGTGDAVPHITFEPDGVERSVVISQKQLAFLVANALMGNSIVGGDGLSKAMKHCPEIGQHDFVYALLSLLAVLSRELQGGGDGTFLIGATPRKSQGEWKTRLTNSSLLVPKTCNKLGGKQSGCIPDDFMTGGTEYQALTDIAGNVVGGGAQLCSIALSQDESLVQFYSEVLAFAFFSQDMLPTPFVLLGARRYVDTIGGQSQTLCGTIQQVDWLNSDIGSCKENVVVTGPSGPSEIQVACSSFVAVASVCTAAGTKCPVSDLTNNNCDYQRRHLDGDIDRWYQAFAAAMYHTTVQDAMRAVLKRIGTGPWGSGVWFGDSQMYFLTMWIATSLLDGVGLDYYIYDHFCENPGNQCFVLPQSDCGTCIQTSHSPLDNSHCPSHGVNDMVSRFQGKRVQDLYGGLVHIGPPPKTVFDLLASLQKAQNQPNQVLM